jgi:hypothetical protein
MKKFNKNSITTIFVFLFVFGMIAPKVILADDNLTPVDLGAASNFVILAKTGISSTGTTHITGDIGISPAAASSITGFGLAVNSFGPFSTSSLVSGKIYAPDYAIPSPANLTTAVLDMQNAYTDAAGRAPNLTEVGAGNIGGMTLTAGVYKWGTGLTIPTDVTLSGTPDDIWIFQVAGTLNVAPAAKVILSGGAQAGNVFWVVAGQTTLGTTSVVNGNILDQTAIALNTGATLNGRALAQSAVTLDSNSVNVPAGTVMNPVGGLVTTPTPSPVLTPPTEFACPLIFLNGVMQHSCAPHPTPNPNPIPIQNPLSITTPAVIAGCNGTSGFSTVTGRSCSGNAGSVMNTTSYNFGTLTLKNGSRGAGVMELQRFMNRFLNLGLVIDGKLGPKTIAVIKKWQSDHGLVADGLIGNKTKAMMNTEAETNN